MFLKHYKVKSNIPLKSSDIKRLRQRLETLFPVLSAEQIQTLVPSKSSLSLLKVITHSNFLSNVYCVDKVPQFFEMEGGVLVPTIYTIWQVPEILPYFTTHAGVLPKLANGADLMLPGVVPQESGLNMYGRFKKMQLVAVNLTTNSVAVGVGYLPRSSDDLYMCGGQGVAVKMLHLFGDKLWGHEPSLVQQMPDQKPRKLTIDDFPALGVSDLKKGPKQVSPAKKSHEFSNIVPEAPVEMQMADQNPRKLTIADFPALGVSDLKKRPKQVSPAEKSHEFSNIVPEAPVEQFSYSDTEPAMTRLQIQPNLSDELETSQIVEAMGDKSSPEDALKNAFLAALKNHGKSLQLPLLTSKFFRVFVLPEATETIDLKKTKYKKLSTFLSEMEDQGFIVVREETKGVDKIVHIDLEHPELVRFITDFKTTTSSSNTDASIPLFHSELAELYMVTDATAAFFTKMDYKRGEGIPIAQIRKIVREYISKQNLPLSNFLTKNIQLDETLQQIMGCSAAPISKICSCIISQMDHSYQMCTLKDVPTNKPLIQMSLATRSGNKKVTLVSNVECYGIIIPEFIKLCKQGAAASTSIVKLPNQNREQLQIQGNQVRFVHNLLTGTYKVPPKNILGLELAKDGKKHKK